ncbi:MAG TPA: endonuclease/exonuclease/phosphatase family protein [Acidimicrobiales bacterium]|nr:endonuclease/exonuclease/phosphatase family protein [Acidimicrobiales bacterium]
MSRVTHGSTPARTSSLVLASFNVHLGMDGWGRPFDVSGACAALDADLLVLQECWTPDGDSSGTAARVARDLGYSVAAEATLAHIQRHGASADADDRWGPRPWHLRRAFHFDHVRERRRPTGRPSLPGRWSIALLARVPVRDPATLWLERLRRDPADRAVLRVATDLGSRELTVMGTHMAHVTDFSPLQYRRMTALLPPADTPAALAGDMNLWGPPVSSFFPAWRRAVVGRTWPAHRPHSQLDHVLITESVQVVEARVAGPSGSDHRPVVVRLALG